MGIHVRRQLQLCGYLLRRQLQLCGYLLRRPLQHCGYLRAKTVTTVRVSMCEDSYNSVGIYVQRQLQLCGYLLRRQLQLCGYLCAKTVTTLRVSIKKTGNYTDLCKKPILQPKHLRRKTKTTRMCTFTWEDYY